MPYGLVTRRISATPRARSGMKLITSADATTSKVASENGSACASATRKSARLATGCRRANSICAAPGSTADTRAGLQVLTMRVVNAPVPQPTSSHAAFPGAASQSRNTAPTARLQRPMNSS